MNILERAWRRIVSPQPTWRDGLGRFIGPTPWSAKGPKSIPRRQYCLRGHELAGDNLYEYVRYRGNVRLVEHICRQCRVIRLRKYKERHAAVVKTGGFEDGFEY